MNITQAFFVHEIVRLRRNIAALERGLKGHNPNDPRFAGQRAMLDNEYRCREALLDLAEEAGDLAGLQLTLRINYGAAKYRHEHLTGRQNGRKACQCDDWWDTLGAMQYYCHLNRSLDTLLREYPQGQVREELRKAVRAHDVSASARRSELLHAIASAEGSAAGKQSLVRHDVFSTNGRKTDK